MPQTSIQVGGSHEFIFLEINALESHDNSEDGRKPEIAEFVPSNRKYIPE